MWPFNKENEFEKQERLLKEAAIERSVLQMTNEELIMTMLIDIHEGGGLWDSKGAVDEANNRILNKYPSLEDKQSLYQVLKGK